MADSPHKAKPSKKRSLIRSAKNKKSGKYVKQRVRTNANKKRRVERLKARFPKYRAIGW